MSKIRILRFLSWVSYENEQRGRWAGFLVLLNWLFCLNRPESTVWAGLLLMVLLKAWLEYGLLVHMDLGSWTERERTEQDRSSPPFLFARNKLWELKFSQEVGGGGQELWGKWSLVGAAPVLERKWGGCIGILSSRQRVGSAMVAGDRLAGVDSRQDG
jgi:hypothetical protein